MQIFADIFNVTTKRNINNDSASLGAAINTAVGLGIYDDYDEAVANMVEVRDSFKPIKENVQLYANLNAIYKDIPQHLDKILERTHEVLA
ncbi:MAG: hypothetical protein QM571_02815 [Micrococcaceae bacterium]